MICNSKFEVAIVFLGTLRSLMTIGFFGLFTRRSAAAVSGSRPGRFPQTLTLESQIAWVTALDRLRSEEQHPASLEFSSIDEARDELSISLMDEGDKEVRTTCRTRTDHDGAPCLVNPAR